MLSGSAAKTQVSIKCRSFQFSVTARQEVDSEVVGKADNGSLGLEPFTSTAPFERFGVKPPKMLNSFTYLTVNNCACIFAHECCEYAEKSVGLLQLQTPVEVNHTHPLLSYLPLDYR